jgi:hypothetical protein
MPSTPYYVARVLFKHGVEADDLEKELASDEASLRAQLDRERADTKAAARERAATPPRSGGRPPIHIPSHETHIDNRVSAISKLRDKQDVTRRKPQRERHSRELAPARSKPATPENHVPQREPEPWQPTYSIWKDLDSAQQTAVRGIWESTARLRDKADADVLDMNKTAGRYMGQKATQDDAQSRHERAHLDINKKEHQQLAMMHSKLSGDLESKRRRIHQDAVERAALHQRQLDRARA